MNRTELDKTIIAQRILSERKLKGWTQKELHEKVGTYSEKTVRDWEKGNTKIPTEGLIKLAEIFECDINYLIGKYEHRTKEATDICKATGLSEEAVKVLLNLQESKHQSLRNNKIADSNRIKRYFGRRELFLNMFIEESAHLLGEVADMKACFEEIVKAKENPYFHMIDNAMKESKYFIESAVQLMYEDVGEENRWREDSVREMLKEKYGKTKDEIEEIYKETDGFFMYCFRHLELQKYQQYDIEQSFMDIVKAYVKEGVEDGRKD